MTKYLLMTLIVLTVSCTSSKKESPALGSLQQESFFSTILNKQWDYSIYYPPEYSRSNTYPVIYLLHGAFDSNTTWESQGKIKEVLDNLITSEKLPKSIVIMPNANNTWYIDSPIALMLSAFEKDLFPFVKTNFKTIDHKNAHIIGGISMGGYGALTLGFRNPDKFGSIISLSPAITKPQKAPSQVLTLILEKGFADIFGKTFEQEKWNEISYYHAFTNAHSQNKLSQTKIFVSGGTLDKVTPIEDTREFVDSLKQYDVKHQYLEVPYKSHLWDLWKPSLIEGLIYTSAQLTNY